MPDIKNLTQGKKRGSIAGQKKLNASKGTKSMERAGSPATGAAIAGGGGEGHGLRERPKYVPAIIGKEEKTIKGSDNRHKEDRFGGKGK